LVPFSLRRRFSQNQEDCTYTTLALLPTATENVLKALPVEDILQELQQRKSEKIARSSTANSEIAPSEVASTIDEEGKSLGSSSFIHASQVDVEGREPARSDIGAGKTKVQLWNDLKISSITRALTLVYTLALLTIFTRIQLNLLGRRNYLSSVISLATVPVEASGISLENRDDDNPDQDYGNDFETNRKYLTFSWWLLHRGRNDVMQKVEQATKRAFGPLKPNDSISFAKLSELIMEVRETVEGTTDADRKEKKWLSFLLPPTSDEEMVLRESGVSSEQSPPTSPPVYDVHEISPILRRLLDETADLVDSPTFTQVLTGLLDAAFSLLIDDKVGPEAYRITPSQEFPPGGSLSSNEMQIQEVSGGVVASTMDLNKERSAKLATVLAVFTRQAHEIGTGGSLAGTPDSEFPQIPGLPQSPGKEANEYLAAMEHVADLKAFAAVVYSSNFDYEHMGTDEMPRPTLPMPIQGAIESLPEEKPAEVLESAWKQALAREDGKDV